jgi:hypothetical protein
VRGRRRSRNAALSRSVVEDRRRGRWTSHAEPPASGGACELTRSRYAAAPTTVTSDFRSVGNLPAVLVDDDGPSDREALAGPPHCLRREERVEDAIADALGDASTRIADRDRNVVSRRLRPHANATPGGSVAARVIDGVRSVDDHVQQRPADLIRVTPHRRRGPSLLTGALKRGFPSRPVGPVVGPRTRRYPPRCRRLRWESSWAGQVEEDLGHERAATAATTEMDLVVRPPV